MLPNEWRQETYTNITFISRPIAAGIIYENLHEFQEYPFRASSSSQLSSKKSGSVAFRAFIVIFIHAKSHTKKLRKHHQQNEEKRPL